MERFDTLQSDGRVAFGVLNDKSYAGTTTADSHCGQSCFFAVQTAFMEIGHGIAR